LAVPLTACNTLIDSAPDIQSIANAVLSEVGAPSISLQETHAFIGEGIQSFVRKMREARDLGEAHQDTLLEGMTARYESAVTLTVMYPGVEEALAELHQSHALGICTNKLRKPALAVLEHLHIDPYFSAVWGGDNPLARKPDPAPLRATFKELGTGPCIYVGDSEVDAETARRAKVPFILFTKGYRKSPVEEIPHTARIDTFKDLKREIDAILNAADDI